MTLVYEVESQIAMLVRKQVWYSSQIVCDLFHTQLDNAMAFALQITLFYVNLV